MGLLGVSKIRSRILCDIILSFCFLSKRCFIITETGKMRETKEAPRRLCRFQLVETHYAITGGGKM